MTRSRERISRSTDPLDRFTERMTGSKARGRSLQGGDERRNGAKGSLPGAVYDIDTARVRWLGRHPREPALLRSTGDSWGEDEKQ